MERKCKCGNCYIPRFERQMRCMPCILAKEPPLPPDDVRDIQHTEFLEWFIYHWHHIRKSAHEAKGLVFEYDDGIIGKAAEKKRKPTVAELARKRGLDPSLVRKRLRLGWTLDKALTQPPKGKEND